jgi:hypothetical protein
LKHVRCSLLQKVCVLEAQPFFLSEILKHAKFPIFANILIFLSEYFPDFIHTLKLAFRI